MSINFNELIENSDKARKFSPAIRKSRGFNYQLLESSRSNEPQALRTAESYVELVQQMAFINSVAYAALFAKCDQYDLQNYGLPQFQLITLIHVILADGFLKSVTDEHFVNSSLDQELTVNFDNFNQAQDNLYKFISGEFEQSDFEHVANLLQDSDFYSFIYIFLEPIAERLELAVNNRTNLILPLSSDFDITGDQMDCDLVHALNSPLLALQHLLTCETGFENSFGYPQVTKHLNFISTNFVPPAVKFSLRVFHDLLNYFTLDDSMYGDFILSCDSFDDRIESLFKMYLPARKDKTISYDGITLFGNSLRDHSQRIQRENRLISARAESEERRKVRNEQRALRKAQEIEAQAQKKEEARLESIRRQELLEQEQMKAELEKQALLERIALEEKHKEIQDAEKAQEIYLEKLHFVVEKKQEIIERMTYLKEQIEAMTGDDSQYVNSFRDQLNSEIASLKSNFESLEDIDSVELKFEIQIDSSKQECLEYIEMLDSEFLSLIS